jgi:integrase
MALYKRGTTWHTHFFVDGRRFRRSLNTSDWRQAKSREKDLIAEAKAGRLGHSSKTFDRLALSQGIDHYLADRQMRVAARSHHSESDHAKPLRAKLGEVTIVKLTVESVLNYIRSRKAAGISNTTINMEIGILRRVLKRAKRWHVFIDDIRPLPERRDIGRAMSLDEKLRLLKVAAIRPEWLVARCAAILALNTTMRGCEIKELRWRDLDLLGETLTIKRSKTRAGERLIPLNADAMRVILELRDRCKLLFGEVLPDWYVLPNSEGNSKPDPMRPMSGWRSAWRRMTRLIICPRCALWQDPAQICANQNCRLEIKSLRSPIAGLRFHDLRHHAITELAESLTSDQTIMSIAGHVSPRMLSHYSHVRVESKRKALDALATRYFEEKNSPLRTSHDTNNDTVASTGERVVSQLLETNGGDDGTRTRGLCRDRAAF